MRPAPRHNSGCEFLELSGQTPGALEERIRNGDGNLHVLRYHHEIILPRRMVLGMYRSREGEAERVGSQFREARLRSLRDPLAKPLAPVLCTVVDVQDFDGFAINSVNHNVWKR